METVNDLMSKSEQIYLKMIEYAMAYGFKILASVIVVIVGFWLANRVTKVINRGLNQKDLDMTISVYLTRIFNVALKIMVVIVAAGILGVETTSFVAILGAAGLAVGLALQGSLANFAGGVLILILRPFRVGDFII